jgi:tetratricopeptide (TPR) repeat protein
LSSIYSTSANLAYYNQGDLAYSYAVQTKDVTEIDKYRRFVLIILSHAPRMMDSSRSVLYYNLGKMDLLRNDNQKAIIHFRSAYALAPSLIDRRLEVEEGIKRYYLDNALTKKN